MKFFTYIGKSCRLGRWGEVKRGDPIAMSNAEAAYVERVGSKDFKPLKVDSLPAGAAPNLVREADPGRVEMMDFREMSWNDLANYCAKLKIPFSIKSSKAGLIQSIMQQRRNPQQKAA